MEPNSTTPNTTNVPNASDKFFASLEASYKTCLEISRKKNADYTGSTDPFANFKNALTIGVSVERGILVRIMDKISRINNLLDHEAQVKDEKLEDTILDLINYAAILKAYLEYTNAIRKGNDSVE